MVQRTDIAGSVGCSSGQVNLGDDGISRHAPSGTLFEILIIPETSAYSYFGGEKCSRRFLTALPSVHAICVETLGPMKR